MLLLLLLACGAGTPDTASEDLMTAALEALGYVDGTVDPEAHHSGVLVNDPRAFQGLSFYSSRRQNGAQLIDMDGEVVHAWTGTGKGWWQHAELLDDGGVIAIVKDTHLIRVDADSRVLWSVKGRFHHDLWLHDDKIYVLGRRARDLPAVDPSRKTLDDQVVVLSMNGKELDRFSIVDALLASPYAFLLPEPGTLALRRDRRSDQADGAFDVLHTNHVEVMDGRLAHLGELYARGNLVLSPRNLNAVLVLDGETHEVLWVWGPNNLLFAHHPTVLDNGNVLLFNNGQGGLGSQVLEVSPSDGRIVWSYEAKGFYSRARGSVQRLDNGHTLITESDSGYVFEVTPEGEIVWRFANPHVRKDDTRMAIWRMTRVPRPGWLD